MARPKVPITSKQVVIDVALETIDSEGLQAVTLRRLAEKIGGHYSSLYYHYRYKDDILRDVLTYVLSPLDPTQEPINDWKDYFLARSRTYFRLLHEHPNLAQLTFTLLPHTFGYAVEDQGAQVLLDAGVPERYVIVYREQIEAAIHGVFQFSYETPLLTDIPEDYDTLRQCADAARAVSPEERLELAIGAILAGIEQSLPKWRASAETQPSRRRNT